LLATLDAQIGAEVLDEVGQGHHEVVEDERSDVDAGHDLLVDQGLLQLVRLGWRTLLHRISRRRVDREFLDLQAKIANF